MNATVICISRTLAAGGADVGRAVAEELGFRYLDDEIINLASEKAQVDPRLLATVEQRASVVSRVMDAIAAHAARPRPSALGLTKREAPQAVAATGKPPAREEARQLIREVIGEVAKAGNAVIVAHAASIPLAGMKGVLRVLVTAPEIVRARRLELEVRIVSENTALQTIQESDRARLSYLRDFYGIADESPTLYDLVINTEVLSHATAVRLIVEAAQGDAA